MNRLATSSTVTVEIYRNNIFRVVGLPVDATSRMVRRRCEEIRIARELPGSTLTSGGRLPLDPPPDQDAVNRAVAAWEDPQQRLIDELFWFWGPDGAARNTPNPTGLAKVVVSVHDRAVEAHCVALDLELLAKQRALTPGERQRCNESWQHAIRDWATVITEPRIWAYLERRVGEIDDPRLTSRFVAELKQALPTWLLEINAKLALDAVETRDNELKGRRQAMRNFARATRLDTDAVDRALQLVAAPALRRIEDACSDAWSAADQSPHAADAIATDLHERLHQPLTVVTRLLTLEHPAARKVRDRVASTLRQCSVEYFNAVGSPALQRGDRALANLAVATALGLLRQAIELASTPTTRGELAEDIAYLDGLTGLVAPSGPVPAGYGGSASANHFFLWGALACTGGVGLLSAGSIALGVLVLIIGIGLLVIPIRKNSTGG